MPNVEAQNIASQKASFGSGDTEIINPSGDVVISGALKTSTVGDLLIGFSMECALWTSTSTTATKGGSKVTSTARAAVNVTVYVDGAQAEPGQVVYCDRLQQVSLTFSSATPMIPIKLTAVAANDEMGVLVWVLGNARAVAMNYRTLVLDDALIDF